jgi:hypothetical protein
MKDIGGQCENRQWMLGTSMKETRDVGEWAGMVGSLFHCCP